MGLLRRCSRLPVIAVIVAAGLAVAACSGWFGRTSGSGGSGSSAGSGTSRATSAPTAGAGGQHPGRSPAATSGPSPSPPATSRYRPARATVIGKSTDVVVNPAVSAALKHAGITITAIAPATAKAALLFPVSGGQIVRSDARRDRSSQRRADLQARRQERRPDQPRHQYENEAPHRDGRRAVDAGLRAGPRFARGRQPPAHHRGREQHQAHRALTGGHRLEQRPRRTHVQDRVDLRRRDAHGHVRSRAPTNVTGALPPGQCFRRFGECETTTMVVVL